MTDYDDGTLAMTAERPPEAAGDTESGTKPPVRRIRNLAEMMANMPPLSEYARKALERARSAHEDEPSGGFAFTPTTEFEVLDDAFRRTGIVDGKLLLAMLSYLEGRIAEAEDDTYRVEQKMTIASGTLNTNGMLTNIAPTCPTCHYLIGPGLTCLCQIQASQATGWACPRCGCVWGPQVTGCECCNAATYPATGGNG